MSSSIFKKRKTTASPVSKPSAMKPTKAVVKPTCVSQPVSKVSVPTLRVAVPSSAPIPEVVTATSTESEVDVDTSTHTTHSTSSSATTPPVAPDTVDTSASEIIIAERVTSSRSVPRKWSIFTESLLNKGLVTVPQLERAAIAQTITRQRIGETLSALGYLSQANLYSNLSEIPGAPSQADLKTLDKYVLDTDFISKYASPEIRALRLVPAADTTLDPIILAVEPSVAMVTLSNLYPSSKIQHVSFANLCKVYLQKSRTNHEASFYKAAEALSQFDGAGPKNFLGSLVNIAAAYGASDIHIEPEGLVCRIRLRVDGLMISLAVFRAENYPAIVEVIKQACKIPASQINQKPIDGKFVHHVAFMSVDIRVSLIPSIKSASLASCVMRLLGISSEEITLEQLGMEPTQTQTWRHWLKNYSGVIVISGPTGAGKTTTIYSALTEVINPDINIVTVEDPVERQLELAKQVQVTRGVLEFDEVLRAFLRHDPDVIVVGEIRDAASAKIAFEAALTGHLVITTLHANSALGIIPRLKSFGVDDLSLLEALKGLTGQRLVRRVCPHCAETVPIPVEFQKLIPGLRTQQQGKGCELCNESGYLGRTLIAEMLPFGEAEDSLTYHSDFHLLQDQVANAPDSVLTLKQHAALKIKRGETTIEEFYRVL